MNDPKKYWYGSSSGNIEIEMTLEQANSASHQGQCDDDVQWLSEQPEIRAQLDKIDPEILKEELRAYGAWEDDQLQDHEENLQRILWIAAGDIVENRPWEDNDNE
jgi:hypothetical protein